LNKIKIHPKYKNLYTHKGRYTIINGGRGSGKSWSATIFLILLTFEAGHKILFTRLTMVSANISIIPEILEKIELLGLSEHFRITKGEIINIQSGSSIIFMGIRSSNGDNTARLKSIAGITTLVVEEGEELTDEATFDKINLSIRSRGRQNRVILILNPATKTHWIYKKFYQERNVQEGYNGIKGNTCYIHTTYKDNQHLSEDFLEEIRLMKLNHPDKYQHVVMGGWLDKSEGVIFNNWEFGIFPQNVDSIFGADWGYSIDPSTLVETYVDKVERKIYLKEHLYKKGLNTSQLTKVFYDVAGSGTIVGDSSEGRLIDEMKDSGLNIRRCKKGAGSVKEGIMLMKDYKLIIEGENLAMELNNYSWKDDETPIDKWNHIIDAARYAIADKLKDSYGVYYIH